MPLRDLFEFLVDEPALRSLADGGARAVAVPEALRAFVLAALASQRPDRPVVVVTPTTTEAERLVGDLRQFLSAESVEMFPAWETLPFERVSPATETMGRRLRVIWRLRQAQEKGEHAAENILGPLSVVVAPVRALTQRLGPHVEDVEPVVVRSGERMERDELVGRLVASGYRREYQVEARGEVAVRGSIVDVWPAAGDHPVRLDLWGDEVERISVFSAADQRSTAEVGSLEAFPCRELIPTSEVRARAATLVDSESWGSQHWERLAEGLVFDGMESWLPWLTLEERSLADILSKDALMILIEPKRLRDRAVQLAEDEAALGGALSVTWGLPPDRELPRLSLPFDRLLAGSGAGIRVLLAVPDSPATPTLPGSGFEAQADPAALAKRLGALLGEGYRVVVAAQSTSSAERIRRGLSDEGLALPVVRAEERLDRRGGRIVVAPISRGFVAPRALLAVLAEADLTGRRRAISRRVRQRLGGRGESIYEDLHVGDYVVHRQHGVARYGGMVARSIGGTERDYLLLEYRGGDRLYVPTDQVDAVRRYTGGETPSLHRMGGAEWQRAKSKARQAISEVAADLVDLYRRRQSVTAHAFPPDTPWQRELEDAFPFEETPDQLRAIAEVKADMERPVPMDRLVCGDVGYGKTEVALRVAFKAVQDGKQVAVLVPTTLLATQHGQTLRDRFAGYPVRVEVLSRFLSAKEQAAVVAGLATGAVDVVIGTHRLLSEDVKFKDLGLLVVDEEQRFGVTHKEKMKRFQTGVHVLTLTATPIPRTLEMSLTGIRDLSLVNTPPEDRQPILTYVGEFDERAAAEAIRRELLREGQVFFVHNRVHDIEEAAERVRRLVPQARVAVAHGQMDEALLERVVVDFWERAYDVLVCTTIIESGIDMPTVNTLVVDRSDLLGLAQLYQLRGRVGRSGQRAYAYLFHPADQVLTEEAYERLKTIGEFTDLGSGFKIAMRDLEIRGAGNLLGGAQSGHIAAVGFDLYCRMVTEALGELTGQQREEAPEVTIDVPVSANLPRDYVSRDDLRMEAYRRLAAVGSIADVDDVAGEWADRYGPPPPEAQALLLVARLRAECRRLGVREVVFQRGFARLVPLRLRESQKVRLQRLSRRAVLKGSDEVGVPLAPSRTLGERPDGRRQVEALLALLAELVPVGSEGVPASIA